MLRIHRTRRAVSEGIKSWLHTLFLAGIALYSSSSLVQAQPSAWQYGLSGAVWANTTVGIGTPNPQYSLDVVGSPVKGNLGSAHLQGDANGWGVVIGESSGAIGQQLLLGYNLIGNYGQIQSVRQGTGGMPLILQGLGGSVGIGTTNPGPFGLAVMNGAVGVGTTSLQPSGGPNVPNPKLVVNGSIAAVEYYTRPNGWPDYVFEPGYRLQPLTEVAEYIRLYRHLPDIPSESEVKAKGAGVSEIQTRLLAKIEELTLHMIRADERTRSVEQQNRDLLERIAKLEHDATTAR